MIYASGSYVRPRGSVRVRLLRTVDLESHQIAWARRIVQQSFQETRQLVDALRMRIAYLQGYDLTRYVELSIATKVYRLHGGLDDAHADC